MEGRGFDLMTAQQSIATAMPATLSAPAAGCTSTSSGELPTQVSLPGLGVVLPPEFAGNICSARAKYGCVVLLGVASNNDERLPVCGSMPSLPEEWIADSFGSPLIYAIKAQGAEHHPHQPVTEIRLQVLIWTGARDHRDPILSAHAHGIL